jgi:predicted TPR repeat methyltransferase
MTQRCLELLHPLGLLPGDLVLDIGCGSGLSGEELSDLGIVI